jgi:radical SAM superfamily enzyme YgiQ (UPF0313 family)
MKLKLLQTPRYEEHLYKKDEKKIDKKLGHTIFLPPLGIATLTAFLKKNHIFVDQDDLRIKVFYHNLKINYSNKQINLKIFNNGKRTERFAKLKEDKKFEAEGEKILKLTNCKGFDAFGFSLSETYTPSTAGVALTLAKLLKEKYDATILIGGNVHFEVAEMMLKTKLVDYLITGEGTDKLLAFCENYENGLPLEKAPGIFFLDEEGKIKSTAAPKEFSERKIPIRPCFDGLPLDLYSPKVTFDVDGTKFTSKHLILPYIFVNGCPHKCAYCPDALGEYKAKTPEEVVEDLKILSKKYRTRYFFFINTEINPTYKYAEEIAKGIIKKDLNILWSDCATFFSMDKALLEKLKKAGAAILIFGLESGSRKVLKLVQKPLPPFSYIKKILKKSYELGIRNELDVLCGFPYETERDVNSTIKLLLEVKKYVLQYHISKFRPTGLIGFYPEKYGIQILELKPSTYRPSHIIPFEEVNGLKWKKRLSK